MSMNIVENGVWLDKVKFDKLDEFSNQRAKVKSTLGQINP